LQGAELAARKKDIALFESLSAFNERFAKLQDSLGAAMKHSLLLAGEPRDSFLKVLTKYRFAGSRSPLCGLLQGQLGHSAQQFGFFGGL
jgi:hypothetical protein